MTFPWLDMAIAVVGMLLVAVLCFGLLQHLLTT
jgi:hypothetical protein